MCAQPSQVSVYTNCHAGHCIIPIVHHAVCLIKHMNADINGAPEVMS